MNLVCPLPAALVEIPQPDCPFKFDQIVRMAFQRRQPEATPPFPTLADAQTLAKWTAFKSAVDAKKLVVSPIFAGLVFPQSEALTTGGNDNSTFNGIRNYNGEGAVTVTGVFTNIPPATKRALDNLTMFSLAGATGISNLTAYFVNRDLVVYGENPFAAGVPSTVYRGIPIYNFRVSSPGSEGFNAPNLNAYSFDLPASWADYIAAWKPNFDPLTEL